MAIDDAPRSTSLALTRRHRPAVVLDQLRERVREDESRACAVPRLERRIADLLGKPAAAMFPSGAMAQQVAMRIHADRRGIRTIAFHPLCHLEQHERKGYAIVHGLTGLPVCDRYSLIQLTDLEAVAEPVAALLLELPQRDIGGRLPEWEDLVAQVDWTREHRVASHLDGARLWEAQPYYRRSHAEIAALFDSVYVSLYKGLLGISGALLAGDTEFVEHARIWRDRLGGNTSSAWPMALAGERGLDEVLPRMPEFYQRARSLAAVLGGIPGVRVVPEPPQTPLFHVHMAADPDRVLDHATLLAEKTGIRLFGRVAPAAHPLSCSFEVSVSEQFDDIEDAEIRDHVGELMLAAG
ncbi:threonine aldolase family protein [Actinocrispum wychmicini]|uniref:L-threonine aldolase n=1 Tax=Actinocrispum wychmicini TaxID=1213861 RepID=A0A4R2JDD9_9PSEU|nr:beta-eliminating lyase-related protein [Actinocrispum wychmicini]TCO56934.1 L-threonine aldolase [Actinocrispum wychmicini]